MKEQLFYVWIEGFSPWRGEKLMSIDKDGNYEVTQYLTKALRVKRSDIPEVKILLKKAGVSDWAIEEGFIRTTYCPKGCMFKSFIPKLSGLDLIKKKIDQVNWEDITLRCEASGRGGGIEISLDYFGYEGEKMAAYQNYLGGGMLGAIQVNDTIRRQSLSTTEEIAQELDAIGEALMRYFHSLTNHEGDEWEEASFEENQKRPVSAY